MKNKYMCMTACIALFIACSTNGNNPKISNPEISNPEKYPTARSKMAALTKYDTHGLPTIGKTTGGGHVYEVNGRRTAVWGVENDAWQTVAKNRTAFINYLTGSKYVNANTIAIHCPWNVMEPTKDVYDFEDLDFYLDKTKEAGLKAILYFSSANYAGGDGFATPKYIFEDEATYTHIKMEQIENAPLKQRRPMCPADPDLMEREKKMITAFFEHLKKVNVADNILSVNIGSEVDFMAWNDDNIPRNFDIRCSCPNCELLYKGQGNLKYMTEIFAQYNKAMIDAATAVYDIPVYTPVASLSWWPGGRYVEQPEYIFNTVHKKNYVVCPSTLPTASAEILRNEVNQFVAIKDNIAFASGIDTGWTDYPFNNQPRLELAPWMILFEYDGLGAIYWDHPRFSITSNKETRERLRTGWGPLKAADYYLSSVKGDKDVLMYWLYEKTEATATLGNYAVTATQAKKTNYGYALLVDEDELAFSATSFNGEATRVRVEGQDSFNDYKFEKGYYTDKGKFVAVKKFTPEINGKTVKFSMNEDSGVASCIYRISK